MRPRVFFFLVLFACVHSSSEHDMALRLLKDADKPQKPIEEPNIAFHAPKSLGFEVDQATTKGDGSTDTSLDDTDDDEASAKLLSVVGTSFCFFPLLFFFFSFFLISLKGQSHRVERRLVCVPHSQAQEVPAGQL